MQLTILGAGSAKPTPERSQSSQLLELRNKQFLIDCGEGTQHRIIAHGVHTTRLNHIFISHLHGDHCFGLMGLISTLGMLGRTADIEIHAQPDLERLLKPQIDYFCSDFPFEVKFHAFNPRQVSVIYDDKSVSVIAFPLKHHVPTVGFLFEEKPSERHLIRDMVDAFEIPIAQLKDIKAGADFVTPDGKVILNDRLTTPPAEPRRYAYCSDTAYTEKIVPIIKGVDYLYHEATYLDDNAARARLTMHSTALQAATIAKMAEVKQLIIGHYSSRYRHIDELVNEAKMVFQNTIGAYDGLRLEL